MLKELASFTQALDPEFKRIGIQPKEGLNVVIKVDFDDSASSVRLSGVEYEIYNRRKQIDKLSDLLIRCAEIQEVSWTLDFDKKPFYQKCFDLPQKGILTVSPFCFATKKKSLIGGSKYIEKDKVKINERVPRYIKKAKTLIDDEFHKYADWLQDYLSTWDAFERFLDTVDGFDNLSEEAHIILHLDLPITLYKKAYSAYLKDYLFNRKLPSVGGESIGVSNFKNGFNEEKPFLKHQTATFLFNGSVTHEFAETVFEAQKILDRAILPRPLPIFIFPDQEPVTELRDDVMNLFKEEARKAPAQRKSYEQIMADLYAKSTNGLSNYYLLYYQQGQIKDFDFVSKFDYYIRDAYTKQDWLEIKNVMAVLTAAKKPRKYPRLTNVFQLLDCVFAPLFGHKNVHSANLLGDLKTDDFIVATTPNSYHLTYTHLSALRYRKAVYDFVFKSKHDAIKGKAFWHMVVSTFQDDMKCGRNKQIKEKLNILFSVNHFFDEKNENFNGFYMPDKLDSLTEKTLKIADSFERVPLEDEYEFAFISGQVIDYLMSLNYPSDESHAALETFIQKTDVELFKQEIGRLFLKHKHEVERPANLKRNRVANLMRELMAFDKRADLKKLYVIILAGYFSPTFYLREN
ncbi:hypothetical protein [Spirosoma fluviale]|uniref:CRISPR-associated protein Csh1 n=1 Tax=Spirosoma fluviale TaxID=1597977 RepID=A0A286GC69_9BACT|nr:hypothetical protein [Spirosoma fluviale]SOD93117.1 CRISPR-associated protein Csh1 [Spirosoma fluviale]